MPLAGLRPNIAMSDVGAAFLAFQITDLEERCAAMHKRLDQKDCSARPRSKSGIHPRREKRALRPAA